MIGSLQKYEDWIMNCRKLRAEHLSYKKESSSSDAKASQEGAARPSEADDRGQRIILMTSINERVMSNDDPQCHE